MVYLSNGQVIKDEPWSLSKIPRFFWGTLNTAWSFVQTLFYDPNTTTVGNSNVTRTRTSGGNGGNGTGYKRPMGRVGGGVSGCDTVPGGS